MAINAQSFDETHDPQAASRRCSIIGLAVTMMLGSLGVSLPYVALPALGEAFGVSLHAVQWIITIYLLAVTTLVVGVGRLGDLIGPRKVLLAGLAVFTLASSICAAAPTFWVLMIGRAVQGAGAAALMALTLVLARQTVPQHAVGRVMGLLGTMSAIGTALGPTAGGLLTAQFGWRAIFLALIPLSLFSLVLVQRTMPARLPSNARLAGNLDMAGTALLGLSVGVYALALSGMNAGWSRLALFLLGLAFLGGFVMAERRAATPLIQLAMLKNTQLVTGLAGNMLTSTVMMATLVVGPFYLSSALGLELAAVGLIVSVGPIIAAVSGLPAGFIVDRFGSRTVVLAGLAQVLGGCISLAVLPRSFGVVGYVAAIAILTSGYQLFLAANNTSVLLGARESQHGVISGALTLSRNLGLATGASLMGGIFASLIEGSGLGDPESVALGMNVTFAVAGALMLFALALVVLCQPSASERADQR